MQDPIAAVMQEAYRRHGEANQVRQAYHFRLISWGGVTANGPFADTAIVAALDDAVGRAERRLARLRDFREERASGSQAMTERQA